MMDSEALATALRPPPERTSQRRAANVGGARRRQETSGTFPPARSWAAPNAIEDRIAGDGRGEQKATKYEERVVLGPSLKREPISSV